MKSPGRETTGTGFPSCLLLHLRFKKSTHCDFRVDRLVMDLQGSSHGHQVCLIILDLDPEAFRQNLYMKRKGSVKGEV